MELEASFGAVLQYSREGQQTKGGENKQSHKLQVYTFK